MKTKTYFGMTALAAAATLAKQQGIPRANEAFSFLVSPGIFEPAAIPQSNPRFHFANLRGNQHSAYPCTFHTESCPMGIKLAKLKPPSAQSLARSHFFCWLRQS